jgi:serine/threonine protein kinase
MLKRLKNIFGTSAGDDTSISKNPLASKKKQLYKEQSPLIEWKLIKELGDGAFGKVYQAYNEQKKQYAASKIIEDCTDDELPEHTVEIEILSECNHINIIGFYDGYYHDKKLYIFLEYCTYGAVDNIMTTLEHGLDEKQIRFIGYEVLEALDYLHTQQFVIHRDIKASNILLTQSGHVKLADFGVSVKNENQDYRRNEYIGTVYW